jgi:hypothetical protein
VKSRKWEKKKIRGRKKIVSVIREDEPESTKEVRKKHDKINVKTATVNLYESSL